jgi:Cu-processing system permease protein
MLGRIQAIALNTYREAVRARVLMALLALALTTCAFSILVATLSLHNEMRVIANIGAASISVYAVAIAIVLGATSLHRELEYKTIFPILARPIARHEYLVGKYLGTALTLVVFVAIDGGAVLGLLALQAGQSPRNVIVAAALLLAILGVSILRARFTRTFVVIPWSLAFFAAMALLAAPAGPERRLVVVSAALTVCEVGIIAAVATLFSSFSSPFLTAAFTFGVFVVGRSADTLAHLPEHSYGQTLHTAGAGLARVFPNLHAYVPSRALLLGEVEGVSLAGYVGTAAAHAFFYASALLVVSALAFRVRDFQ